MALARLERRIVRRRGIAGPLVTGISLLALAWAGGFVWFAYRASQPVPVPPRSDGIVALTGGADRVSAALGLLAEHKADRLLVTGVGGHAGLRDVARSSGIDPAPIATEVTLGRGATSTRGNAAETAAWARAHHMRSLIVVTAFYHMPRALAEIGRALPGVTLHPATVAPPPKPGVEWFDRLRSAQLLASEYVKFIVVALGLTDLLPTDAPRLSPARPETVAADSSP